MATVVLATLILIGASLIAWWRFRHRTRIIAVLAGAAGVAGTLVFGVSIWALTATDTSQLARAMVWGESSYGDQDRFPTATMSASVTPVVFAPAMTPIDIETFVSQEPISPLADLLEANATTAFIVLRGDELLYENYFNGSSAESTQTSFSVAKSFIATLVGIAIDEGAMVDLDEPITTYVPELLDRDERFGAITLHDLLTMSSGLSFDDGPSPWADPANTYHGTNLRTAALSDPDIEQSPGQAFHYNDWNVILLGLALERATGQTVTDYMTTKLWQPMGAEADGSWSLDSNAHRFEKMFVGVNGRAIDFAKLGWLYLHDGRNGDDQVVPADFIADATRVDDGTDPASSYQYLWWIDEPRNAFYANGDHGQFIYVDPESELVIVRHGSGGGAVDWVALFGELADWIDETATAG